jgi:GTP-binding protein YchF
MLKIGIIGLPNVGKSTLFKALTSQKVNISNYPFCTIEPNKGIVEVFDYRLIELAQVFPRPNLIYSTIEFVDIAGLVKGASQGQGLGNKFLSHIREVDVILELVRFFDKKEIVHVNNEINPQRDIEILSTELLLADLEVVDNYLQKLERKVRSQDPLVLEELEIVKKIKILLQQEKFLNQFSWNKEEEKIIKQLGLISAKPFLYLYNYCDAEPEIESYFLQKKHFILDVKLEEEMKNMKVEDLEELKIKPKLNQVIRICFELLDLITFFTMNVNEIRAWKIKKGTRAPEAGGKIHRDFQDKFIRAEVIQWDKLIKIGSFQEAKNKGLLQIVGKDYLVQDGDLIHFLI